MDNPQDITVLSLCAGYGGLELGLARALANPLRVIAVEIEAYALANLVEKAEEGKLAVEVLWPDLRTFPAERFRGCFDFILAGYPCQPFSVAGKRQGTDDPRHLWPAIARIVAAVEPLWCFFENVPGHLSLGFPDVYCSLRDMGYEVEAGLFTAAECGAPHRRQRLFILAHLQSERNLPVQQQRQRGCLESSGQSMADGKRSRQSQSQGSVTEQRGRTQHGGEAMADAEHSGARPGILQESQAGIGRDRLAEQRWPARPGEPQYEWEEPRVVGDTEYTRQGRTRRAAQRLEHRPEMPAEEAEPCVGLSTDGASERLDRSACRVDELRVLGNGCVPAQVERAFRSLWQKHVTDREQG